MSNVYRIGDRDCLLFVKGVFRGGPKKGVEEKSFGLRLIDFHFRVYEHHVLVSAVRLPAPSEVALRHQIVACPYGAELPKWHIFRRLERQCRYGLHTGRQNVLLQLQAESRFVLKNRLVMLAKLLVPLAFHVIRQACEGFLLGNSLRFSWNLSIRCSS